VVSRVWGKASKGECTEGEAVPVVDGEGAF
jgi:hypothetical protein